MNSKYKILLKDTVIFAVGSIGSKIIIFLLVPLYTNYLTIDEYGIADLVFTIGQLLIPFASVVIFDAVIRFGLSNKNHPESVLLNGIIVWIIGSFICILFAPLLYYYDSIQKWTWYIVVYTSSNILLSILLNYLKVKDKNWLYTIVSIVYTLLTAIFSIFYIVILKKGVEGYLFSMNFATVLTIFIIVITGNIYREIKNAKLNNVQLMEMIKYSSPLVFNNLAWWVMQSLNKILIEYYVGISALGLFSIATRMPSLVNVGISIFQQSWSISSIKEIESSNDYNYYKNVFNIYSIGVFFICLIINSIIKPFMQIYVGIDFYEAWRYVPMLICATAFSAIATYFGSLYAALKKSKNNMITTVIAAIINITISILLIPLFGVWGAIIGTLISYFVLSYIRLYDVIRYLKIGIDLKKLLVNWIIIVLHAFIISYKFSWYISIIFILFFIGINHLFIKNLIYNINDQIFNKKRF